MSFKNNTSGMHILLLMILFNYNFISSAQTSTERDRIIKNYDIKKLKDLANTYAERNRLNKVKAYKYAQKQNLRTKKYYDDDSYAELQDITADSTLIYYRTNNIQAAESTRTDYLNAGGGLGLNLNGQNMTAYVWDGGHVLTSHQEFEDLGGFYRVTLGDIITEGGIQESNHATHVTGIINAEGEDPLAKGMAFDSNVISYMWNDDTAEVLSAASIGMLVSNHSYSLDPVDLPDYFFGGYTYYAYEWDVVSYNAPFYLMVVSAGNLGNSNLNGTPLDSNLPQYDKLTGQAVSKNNLSVANANDANIDVNGDLVAVNINSGSSQGPTDDLRIKPDITGNGTYLYSPIATSDTAYATYSGTSMSAPNVSGSLLLLQQHHNDLFNTYMRASTLKGLALHTSDDAGINGPDAIFGWGLFNAKNAAETLSGKGTSSIVEEIILNQGETYSITVDSDGVNDLLASVSWTDPAGTWTANLNDSTPVLVNDLDIEITQNSTTYYPWRLTGVDTNANDADNLVDNFERVDVPGANGSYTINVTHKGTLINELQQFSLIVTGITNVSAFCSAPQNVNVSDMGTTTAEVSWNTSVSSPSDGYDIYFNTTGVPPDNTTIPNTSVSAGVTNISLSGLMAGTTYFLFVRADCGSSNTSEWSEVNSFSTLCSPNAFPYYENFNSSNSIPSCWSQSRILQSEIQHPGSCGINSTNFLKVNGSFHFIESPPVDVSSESVVEVNYDIRNGCAESADAFENIDIYYWNGSIWALLDSIDPANLAQFWVHKSYRINTGLNNLFRLKFQRRGGSLDSDDISIDNIEIKAPTSPPPNDDVCNATLLSVNNSTTSGDAYTLKAATAQVDEPNSNLVNGVDGSVWFTFDAPSSGDVRITTDLVNAKSDDAEMAVYTASDCSDFNTFTQIGFDQDDGRRVNIGHMPVIDLQGLNAGQPYYIQVDRLPDSSSSTFGIEVISLDFTYDDINEFLPINPNGKDLSATEGDLVGGTLNIISGTAKITSPTGFKTINVNPASVLDLDEELTSDIWFKSDSNGSGQLDDATGGSVIGEVTVERFIPAGNRAFRFLASPVRTSSSIRFNWQDDGGNTAGVGTHITGPGGSLNGFDTTGTNNPSMFRFNNNGNTTASQNDDWQTIQNTNLNVIEDRTPYLLFVRGDRTIDLTANPTPSANSTTLKASGSIFIGRDNSQTLSQGDDLFSLVANPYQAVIDFSDMFVSNDVNDIRQDIIIFNPSFGTFGQYETLTGSDRLIQPGQSFFVQNVGSVSHATIEFKESHKNTTANTTNSVFSNNTLRKMDLHLYNENNISLDVLKFRFKEGWNNAIDNQDTGKLFNGEENLSSENTNTLLSVERRNMPQNNELIPLNIIQYQGSHYEFRVDFEQWDPNLEVFVFDHYLNEQKTITPSEVYSFSVDTTIPQTLANDRFSLGFENTTLDTSVSQLKTGFKMYPNPTNNGRFNVKAYGLNQDEGNIELKVYNMLGQQVLDISSASHRNSTFDIDASGLTDGVYMVELKQGDNRFVAKLLID